MQRKIYKITDKEFNDYGKVLEGYDFNNIFNLLSELKVPEDGIYYQASVKALEADKVFLKMQERGFGGLCSDFWAVVKLIWSVLIK